MYISISSLSTLIAAIGVLVAIVNIVVEVLKKVTWDKIPTNILALLVSEGLTITAFFAYCQIYAINVAWYFVVSAIIVGIMVAYAAMFGYDKLKEVLKGIQTIVDTTSNADAAVSAEKEFSNNAKASAEEESAASGKGKSE